MYSYMLKVFVMQKKRWRGENSTCVLLVHINIYEHIVCGALLLPHVKISYCAAENIKNGKKIFFCKIYLPRLLPACLYIFRKVIESIYINVCTRFYRRAFGRAYTYSRTLIQMREENWKCCCLPIKRYLLQLRRGKNENFPSLFNIYPFYMA